MTSVVENHTDVIIFSTLEAAIPDVFIITHHVGEGYSKVTLASGIRWGDEHQTHEL
jgi:hypothetical protein